MTHVYETEELYYFDETERLVLKPGMTEAVLTENQQRELVEQLIMGRCPFCYKLLPEGDMLCKECLNNVLVRCLIDNGCLKS